MNKTELITAVAEKAGITKKDTESVIAATLDVIAQTLAQGDKVQLAGFGIFEVKNREARTGRNPHTGEAMEIAATKIPSFKAYNGLKDSICK